MNKQDQIKLTKQDIKDLKVILNKTGDLIDQKKEFIKFLEND